MAQLCPNTAVRHSVADPDDHAADQCVVHLIVHLHLPEASGLKQFCFYPLFLLCLSERQSRSHPGYSNAL